MRNYVDTAVNAGSMADIAFLLLIFFLVSTKIPSDEGILQKLPPPCKMEPCSNDIPERNIFEVLIGKDGDLLVEGEPIQIQELRQATRAFLDNNGDKSCRYCHGNGLPNLSDRPEVAVISLRNDRETPYEAYVTVLNELIAAYSELRAEYAKHTFDSSIKNLSKDQWQEVKQVYPKVILEAETSKDR